MADDPKDPSPAPLAPRALSYPVSRLAPRYDLVDLAKEIAEADQTIGVAAGAKLDAIREQMRALREQAEAVLLEAQKSAELHRAHCTFKKLPGRVYHLYRRPDGELYFSMLSPEEWNGAPPHAFEGSYRLEVDMSFSPADSAPRNASAERVRALLGKGE